MTSRAGTCKRGFTLVELMVVITILGIMLGVMTPLFRNSYTSLQAQNAYKNIAAVLKHAQERAIMEGREFRVNFDARKRTYWLSYREDPMEFPAKFVNLLTDAGRARVLPEKVTFAFIKANRVRNKDTRYITFYPNGTADKATVRLRDMRYRSLVIETGRSKGIVAIKES